MKVLLIGYNLNAAARSYDDFTTALHDLGDWWHHLNNTWLIRTDRDATEVRDALKPLMADTDELLVLNVSVASAAWTGFDESGDLWLAENL